MNWLSKILICTIIAISMWGCNKSRTISDDKLRLIFKDIYLSNAYCSNNYIRCDTLDIYRPILSKYGYTPEDFKVTIANFSRRKSSRLSDVIETAIKELETEYDSLAAGVAKLDTIDARAGERFKRLVHRVDSLRIKSVRDTAKLRITLPVEVGRYNITYVYRVDTVDKNGSLRATHTLLDSASKQINYDTHWFVNKDRKRHTTNIEANERAKKLEIVLGNYPKNLTTPSLMIDSLRITYYLPKKVAIDSVNKLLVDYKLIIDDKEWSDITKDSSSLYVVPPRIAPKSGSNPK